MAVVLQELEWSDDVQSFLCGVFVGAVEAGRLPPGLNAKEAFRWRDMMIRLEGRGEFFSEADQAELVSVLKRALPRTVELLRKYQEEWLNEE